jgi:uracil phosphoribosyltransferase
MLATGGSATATIDVLKRWGVKRIKFVGIIGAPEGIKAVHDEHPELPVFLADVDRPV